MPTPSARSHRPSMSEIARFLALYGIPTHDLRVRLLRGGCDNLNLLVDAAGTQVVLRRYDVTDPAEVPWELELIRFLHRRGFPTAEVLTTCDDRLLVPFGGRVAALFRYVRGTHPPRSARWAAWRVAATVGELHVATTDYPAPPPRSRTDMHRLQRYRSLMRAAATHDPDALWLLGEVEARLAWYESHREAFAALPRGVVHHDAHAGNVLVAPDKRLLALLDFDEAYEDFLATDLGRCVRLWGTVRHGGALVESRVWRIVSAYEYRRPLSADERYWLPEFILLTSLADVAEYATPRLTSTAPLAGSGSYATYRSLLTDGRWRGALDPFPARDEDDV